MGASPKSRPRAGFFAEFTALENVMLPILATRGRRDAAMRDQALRLLAQGARLKWLGRRYYGEARTAGRRIVGLIWSHYESRKHGFAR